MDSRHAFAQCFGIRLVKDSDDPSASEQQGAGESDATQTVDAIKVIAEVVVDRATRACRPSIQSRLRASRKFYELQNLSGV
jgi:hypothetical protein